MSVLNSLVFLQQYQTEIAGLEETIEQRALRIQNRARALKAVRLPLRSIAGNLIASLAHVDRSAKNVGGNSQRSSAFGSGAKRPMTCEQSKGQFWFSFSDLDSIAVLVHSARYTERSSRSTARRSS